MTTRSVCCPCASSMNYSGLNMVFSPVRWPSTASGTCAFAPGESTADTGMDNHCPGMSGPVARDSRPY